MGSSHGASHRDGRLCCARNMKIRFLFLPLLVVMAALSEGRSLEKRQTQSGDRFFLFGQVMRSLVQLFNTAVDEGGKFISRQVEVGEPVVQTVGNISNVIATSPFGNTVQRTVEDSAGSVVRNTQCVLCGLQPEGERGRSAASQIVLIIH